MRSSHSGVLGNPLTPETLTAALDQPATTRRQLPACASKSYSVLGRTDPLALGAADHAAFATLNEMLTAVDPDELASRPASPPPLMQKPAASSSAAADGSTSRGRGRGAAPSGAPAGAPAYVDQFPPPPGTGSHAASPFFDGSPPPRHFAGAPPDGMARRPVSQQSSRRGRSATRLRGSPGAYAATPAQHTYNWSASRRFTPGGVPPANGAAAASAAAADVERPRTAPLSRTSSATSETLRSPGVLSNFGKSFAAQPRPGSRGLLRPSGSAASLRSTTSVRTDRPVRGALQGSEVMSDAMARSLARSFYSSRDGLTNGFKPRTAKPAAPIVPLIAPVPTPLLAKHGGAGYAAVDAAAAAQQAHAARQYSSLAASDTQNSLRLVIADMMMGLQSEHGASLASYASDAALLGGSAAASQAAILSTGSLARASSAPRF